MAGGDFIKSSPKSFLGGSKTPKPKQASIMSFFSAKSVKKTTEDSPASPATNSPLSQSSIVAAKENVTDTQSPLVADSSILIDYSPMDDSEFLQDASFTISSPKKAKVEFDFTSLLKSNAEKGIVAPRILSELNQAVGSGDFDSTDPTAAGRYPWLVDIKDAKGRRKGEPGYDERTLFIPEWQWAKFTPFEKQFWEIKCQFFDTVVFFKKGKFFELYENDADIGAREFNLKMTDRINMRMAGVPEATFDFWAAKFVGKGYKVAKVDQLENAVSKGMREKSEKSKAEKIIRRELASILTCGTLVDGNHLKTDNSNYCMSIKIEGDQSTSVFSIGAAFVDASSAKFFVVDFEDDANHVILETLLNQTSPREIVFEKTQAKSAALKLAKRVCPYASIVMQDPLSEFWDVAKTANELDTREYFKTWPACLTTCHSDRTNSFSAFGSLISYLRVLKLDYELLSYADVSKYEIMKMAKSLILDGQCLEHLQVCSATNDQKNTLLGLVDRCCTSFGHRLMRSWVLHPLVDAEEIKLRQESVSVLMDNFGAMVNLTTALKSIPDLERLCTRIHAGTISIKSFVDVLNGFKIINSIRQTLASDLNLMKSRLLHDICSSLPDYTEELEYFFTCFDHAIATRDGVVQMRPGACLDLDSAEQCVSQWEARFEQYLKEQEVLLKYKPLKFKDVGKEIYQIEAPANLNVPSEFMVMSKTKACKRYWTPELRKMVQEYLEAKESLTAIQGSVQQTLYQRFSENKAMWRNVVALIGALDCLLSLAHFSRSIPEPRCLASVHNPDSQYSTQFQTEDLRHPIVACFKPEGFVSNSLKLSSEPDEQRVMILTGANMGGKSTLLRQIGLAAILAQLGSFVPAKSLQMTPFDRIFTRLGANDNIIGGESTFKVELSETAKILKHATARSLVIMDELGRGTSTFDGVAIAEAVLHYLLAVTRACVLFSTHYNMLCDTFASEPAVGLYYMNCLVDEEKKKVTFLYKLSKGVSPKSYGIHVAHMAGIPTEVIECAGKYCNPATNGPSIMTEDIISITKKIMLNAKSNNN